MHIPKFPLSLPDELIKLNELLAENILGVPRRPGGGVVGPPRME